MCIILNFFSILCLVSVYLCFSESTTIIKYSDIDELKYLNRSVEPCDDFYEFACGNFRTFHPLNERNSITQFTILSDEILKAMKEILVYPDNTNLPEAAIKAKTAYEACLHHNTIDLSEVFLIVKSGGMPILQEPIPNMPNFGWDDIGSLTATYGVPMLFEFTITSYPVSTTDNLLMLEDDTFLISSADYSINVYDQYKMLFDDFKRYASEYQTANASLDPFFIYLRTVLRILRDEINTNIKNEYIDDGIRQVAKFMKDIQEYAGIPKDANISAITTTTVVEKLQEWTDEQFNNDPPINWISYLAEIFSETGAEIDSETFIFVNTTYVYNILNIIRNTNSTVLKNFALIRILLSSSIDGSTKIMEALLDYYKAKKFTIFSRSDYCAREILDTSKSNSVVGISLAASKLFANKTNLTKAKKLVEKISETFKKNLIESEWMDEESITAALEKEDSMIHLVGVPDLVSNDKQLNSFYKGLRVDEMDNYGDMQRLRAFKQSYTFSQMRKPRNRAYWDISPFETNAYYDRGNNKFIIPLAMLYPMFFRGNLPLIDYAHLGFLVGHETTHGFDNAGSRYDALGVIGNWWTSETHSSFQNKSQCFRDQYSGYFINELKKNLSGDTSLNENLADNGGLKIAYNAAKDLFSLYQFESNQFTSEQLFFIGFATTFCSVEDVPYLKYTVDKGYAPSKYRVNGAVSNMEEFAKAFKCPKKSPMNPDQKCSLW